VDYAAGRNYAGIASIVTVAFGAGYESCAHPSAPAAYRTHINDLLLTALAITMTEWTGRDELLVNLEGHGRQEAIIEGADLSRMSAGSLRLSGTCTAIRLRTEP